MLENPTRYTITAALPYTNGPIHIGHLAGVYVPSDIYSRYLRLQGRDVLFVCGSDEHGVAISMKAKKEGITPQEVIDKYDGIIRKSFVDFGISFDNYSRTSAKIHHETASEFFKTLYDKGDFIEEVTEQLYDAKADQFLADRFVTGTCPKCGNEEAYGDQCEKCGSTLNATDLINPKSTITGETPILKSTKHWFLPLNRYEDFLKEWILVGHKNDWKPNVYGQVKSWIDGGLEPRAVTRDLDWGIDVPVEGAEGKKLYVWFDAPIGYISAAKQWALDNGNSQLGLNVRLTLNTSQGYKTWTLHPTSKAAESIVRNWFTGVLPATAQTPRSTSGNVTGGDGDRPDAQFMTGVGDVNGVLHEDGRVVVRERHAAAAEIGGGTRNGLR